MHGLCPCRFFRMRFQCEVNFVTLICLAPDASAIGNGRIEHIEKGNSLCKRELAG